MRSKDLKIAGILTLICFLFSYALSLSYANGWALTRGAMPLILTIVTVFLATISLEFKHYFVLPVHGLLWLLLRVLEAYASLRRKPLRTASDRILKSFSHAHG
jgi:hypothetical protein